MKPGRDDRTEKSAIQDREFTFAATPASVNMGGCCDVQQSQTEDEILIAADRFLL